MGRVFLTTRIDGQTWYWTGWAGWSRRRDQAKAYTTAIEAEQGRVLAVSIEHEEPQPEDS